MERRVLASVIPGLAVCVLLVMSSVDAASAQTGSRQTATFTLAEQRPGASTALSFSVDYVNPADRAAKPPAVRRVVETLARGARFDTSVPAQCLATDAELMLLGEDACPPGSKVGAGFIRIDTGFPGPNRAIEADIVFLNRTGQLIFVNTDRATGARVVARGTIEGGRLTTNAPPLPGTPPDGGAIDVVRTRLESISRLVGGVRRGYITTPASCPPSRSWTNTVSFTYADGVTQTVASRSPCLGSAPAPPRPCGSTIDGTRRNDRLIGSRASERIRGFGGNDYLAGRGRRDCLSGGQGRDGLYGGAGPDRLTGGPGRDVIAGGTGRDVMLGGSGNDLIRARGSVRDRIHCGTGRDTVEADSRDRLMGCERVRRR
jgi:hypothetical protein